MCVDHYKYKIHQIHSCIEFDKVESNFNKYIDDVFEAV